MQKTLGRWIPADYPKDFLLKFPSPWEDPCCERRQSRWNSISHFDWKAGCSDLPSGVSGADAPTRCFLCVCVADVCCMFFKVQFVEDAKSTFNHILKPASQIPIHIVFRSLEDPLNRWRYAICPFCNKTKAGIWRICCLKKLFRETHLDLVIWIYRFI